MDDVRERHAQPDNPPRPVVCLDEPPRHLLEDVRPLRPAAAGRPARGDDEDRRGGPANRFLVFEPNAGGRHVAVSEPRTTGDFAQQIKARVDLHRPQAGRIAVGLDNRSTHRPAALDQTFQPEDAFPLMSRLEFHDTPRHGGWLNMAAQDFSGLDRQCRERRIPNRDSLPPQTTAREQRRNAKCATAHWHFTVDKARTKRHRLYPT